MIPSGPKIAAVCFIGLLTLAPLAAAASPAHLTGSIAGEVRSAAGVPQMGAAVVLLNRYDRVIERVLTNENGRFIFDSLLPDLYSVRVTLSSFVPAMKRNIAVQSGLESMLTINLAGVLSSIELVYTAPPQGTLMSDDWKWILRSAQSTRPVLRFTDTIYRDPVPGSKTEASVFSETRGLVRVSAGDGGSYAAVGAQPDLGTAFAVSTSVFGSNEVEVSGNFGYTSRDGMPTAGFRTTYSRRGDAIPLPVFSLSMRQISLPSRNGFGPSTVAGDGPALRTTTATMMDHVQVLENVWLDYGLSFDSVSMLDHVNTISPFGRLTFDLGSPGMIQVAYSSGSAPVELAATRGVEAVAAGRDQLNENLSALAALPLMSVVNGHARVQRSDSVEVGYQKRLGSRTYSFGAYRERVRDAILTMAAEPDFFAAGGDLLPDLGSDSSIFNAGNFERWGYLASVSQRLTDKLDATLAYGRTGALGTSSTQVATAEDLRSSLNITDRNWATLRLSGTAPVIGTQFVASYGWMDTGALMPARISMTQTIGPEPGMNFAIRQPLPSGGVLPGRLEAVAEMRNLMGQGYLTVESAAGKPALLTNAPRSVRGGLSFIF